MSKDESVNVGVDGALDLQQAIDDAVAKAFANVASAAASSGTSTGNVQADAGIAGRYAGSGVDFGADTGQAEAWTNLNLRRAENQEAFDQVMRLAIAQSGTNGQVIANRQNQGAQSTSERINAIQENSLMFDNDWLIAYGLQNPVFRELIVGEVVKAMKVEK